ncbi:DDE-type integrase/transposase/recombinase [Roseomonas harenae]
MRRPLRPPGSTGTRLIRGRWAVAMVLLVNQHGVVLDILVQDRRNGSAAKRFLKRLLACLKYKPHRLV